jgi:hypothetical protein
LSRNSPPLHLKTPILAPLAVALETAGMVALDPNSFDLERRLLIDAGFGLALVFAAINRHFWPMRLLALGLGLNLCVMLANGGLMPVTPAHAIAAGFGDEVARLHSGDAVPRSKDVLKAAEETKLTPLSDRIVWPKELPGRAVFSPGDVIVALAVVLAGLVGLRAYLRRDPGHRVEAGTSLAGAHPVDS